MSGTRQKILEDIHPVDIIREVQKWPALYAKDSPERAMTHLKMKIWNKIAKELFSGWDLYSENEKSVKISDLMKKWRNLRDTWKRQVEVEKKIREGHKIKKKVYVYYNHMAFLLPHITDGDSDQEDSSAPKEPEINSKRKHRLKETNRKHHDQSVTQSTTAFIDDIDEDKHFLMSLIPSFKRMNEDDKLTVKMEILKVIKGVRQNSNSSAASIVDSLAYSRDMNRSREDIKTEICREVEFDDGTVTFLEQSSYEDESD